ncbi:MAG: GNAT family N-acetyltransferase [Microthrixaceae bacterium]
MTRQRLGVVLLVPEPLATQIDGLRRALGDGALGRIPPHVTLVPPVNVAERDLPAAFAVVREAASVHEPIALRLGPVRTFDPVSPVAYLEVGGADDALAALVDLRGRCLAGPLDRPQDHEFVPHVTVADRLASDRLHEVTSVLRDFAVDVTIDRVHVLAEQPGRVWVPIADVPLGARPEVVGRGSLPLELSVSGRPDLEAAAILAIESDAPGLPYAITARREGIVVGAAWGWTVGGHLEVADLAVGSAHRMQGIGRHLVVAIEALGRRRDCTTAGVAAPEVGAAAALLHSCGWTLTPLSGTGSAGTRRRWQRQLGPGQS